MKRRRFSSEFKAKVVLEVLQERLTAQEIATKHKIHPQQITTWKSQFLAGASGVFDKGSVPVKDEGEAEKDRLLRLIGEQKVEIDFLKKKL